MCPTWPCIHDSIDESVLPLSLCPPLMCIDQRWRLTPPHVPAAAADTAVLTWPSRTDTVRPPPYCPPPNLYPPAQAREGIPSCSQGLVYAGRQLQDEAVLLSAACGGVSAGSTLHLVLRLRGGKGGFGALLRGQGRDGKVTSNFDAMRDLQVRLCMCKLMVGRGGMKGVGAGSEGQQVILTDASPQPQLSRYLPYSMSLSLSPPQLHDLPSSPFPVSAGPPYPSQQVRGAA